jgi:putative DNA primase/helicase
VAFTNIPPSESSDNGSSGSCTRASRAHPCPVCEAVDGCSVQDDGLIRCRKRSGDQPGFAYFSQAKNDQMWGLYRFADDPTLSWNQPGGRSAGAFKMNGKAVHATNGAAKKAETKGKAKPAIDFAGLAVELAANLTPARRDELAAALGLPPCALSVLPLIGYAEVGPHLPRGDCWTFPEVDGTRAVVAINCRYRNNEKKVWKGGRHSDGLTIPDGLETDATTPLLIAEGASCVLAGRALGLCIIGRPNNVCGADALAVYLEKLPEGQRPPIIVLGEFDPKPDGKWPGKEGAEKVAAALKAKLGDKWDIRWAMPPDGKKDVRAWVIDQHLDPTCIDEWHVAGERFLAAVKAKPNLPPKKKPPKSQSAPVKAPPGFFELSDIGNAERLAKRHGHALRHCHPWKDWLAWDGKRWAVDDTGAITRRAIDTVRAMCDEAKACKDDKQRLAILAHALRSEGAKPVRAMIDLARSLHPIPILPSEMDVDPWLLNVENGTIDLRTGLLRDHRREDLLTKLAPVVYDPAAECPRWMAFLRWAMAEDKELVAYLQRIVGYGLTGDVSEQILLFFYGVGGNGKSTFLVTLLKMLGDYAMQAVSDLLMAKKNESHPTERADLFGKRFVATIETEQGKAIAEALMKQLTGGDPIKARKLFKDFFQFDPTHKIILAANHKPVIRGIDHANWRRIKLVPWKATITETEKDKDLPSKLLKELPGILAWAVRGCLEWQRDGLKEPAVVTEATAEYRKEQDVFKGFIADCCEIDEKARVKASVLLEAYQQWTGDKVMGSKEFSQRLTDMNYKAKRESTGVFYRGIGLAECEPM